MALGAVLFGTTLGALWGLACGYFGGRFDMVSQRIIEFLQSFPDLILAMAIAMALGAGIGTVIVAIAITRIPFGGRVIRSVVLSLKEMQYVEAARGLGASHQRLMFRHILPQCVAPYLILATTHLGVAIVIEASLGFLGVGIPPPTPTWGNMLSDALNAGLVPPWWLVLFPGGAITLTVLAFNLLGRRHPRHARSAAAGFVWKCRLDPFVRILAAANFHRNAHRAEGRLSSPAGITVTNPIDPLGVNLRRLSSTRRDKWAADRARTHHYGAQRNGDAAVVQMA